MLKENELKVKNKLHLSSADKSNATVFELYLNSFEVGFSLGPNTSDETYVQGEERIHIFN